MAGKIIANLVILGSGVLLRAASQAYRQALVNASKSGGAQDAVRNVVSRSSAMTESEARMVLGITEKTSVEEMLEKYERLFEKNAESGSFYLQSKVQRAKECLERQMKTDRTDSV